MLMQVGFTGDTPTQIQLPDGECFPMFTLRFMFISSQMAIFATQRKDLTISSYHVMNHPNLDGYIPNVTQENRSLEAKDAANQLLRMLPHLENQQNEENKQNQECLEHCLEQFVADFL